jgi:Heavy metal associated domain 2
MYEARVVHHIPGRMRIRMPSLKDLSTSTKQMNDLLLPVEGLRQVDFSPITGSVLLHYDPELHDSFPQQLTKYVRSTMGLNLVSSTSRNGTRASAPAAETFVDPVIGDTRLARDISSFFQRINKDVRVVTGQAFDLKSLLPLGLATYTLFKIGSTATTPLWVTLGIFSFTSFVILNPVSVAVETDNEERRTVHRKKPRRKPTKSQ